LRFPYITYSWVGWLENGHNPVLRLISGIVNLKSQGILQIDVTESKSIYLKLSRDWLLSHMMISVGQGIQGEMGLGNVLAHLTFFFYLLIQILRVWPKKKNNNKKKQCSTLDDMKRLRVTSIMLCLLSMDPVWWWSWYFLLFDRACHMIWYEQSVWLLLYSCLYNRCRWG